MIHFAYLPSLALRVFRSRTRNHLKLLAKLLRQAQLLHNLVILGHGLLLLAAQFLAVLFFFDVAIEFVLEEETIEFRGIFTWPSGNPGAIEDKALAKAILAG